MRIYLLGVALAFAMVLGYSGAATAQTKQPSEAPAAPNSFDPHDLSGVWMQDRPRLGKVVERYWIY